MSFRDRKVIVALAAVMLLPAGCGTTVSGATSGELAAPGGGGRGLAPSMPGSAPGVGSGSGAVLSPGGGLAVPGVGGSANRPAGSKSIASGAGGAAAGLGSHGLTAADGPGVTATTIKFAGVYCSSCAAGNEALGAADASSGDIRAEINAVTGYVNAHG